MILAQSDNYIISNEFETAYLINKKNGKIISAIAEMYGDPIAAQISEDEKFCVIIGCGAVIYWLREPFNNYICNCCDNQWHNVLVDSGVWFDNIVNMNNKKVILHSENDALYEIDVYSYLNKKSPKAAALGISYF